MPKVGDRVMVLVDVELFPHGIVHTGETGVVTEVQSFEPTIVVKLDSKLAWLKEWDNTVGFSMDPKSIVIPFFHDHCLTDADAEAKLLEIRQKDGEP